jgi:hypothetical protein
MNGKRAIWASLSLSLGALCVSGPAAAAYSPEFGSYTEGTINYSDATRRQYGEWSEAVTHFDKSDRWGNGDFNAGYRTWGYTSAGKNSRRLWTAANAAVTTDVTIFGNNTRVFDVYSAAHTDSQSGAKAASYSILVKGYTVSSGSTTTGDYWSKTLPVFSLEFSKKFYVAGWLPVKVGAKALGNVFMGYSARLHPQYMTASLTGGGGLYAEANGSVGESWLLGAKAWASLTLVEPSARFSAMQSWELKPSGGNCNVTFWKGFNGDLSLKALGGNVKAQAQFFGGTETGTIFSWSGFTTNYPLFPTQMTARTTTDAFACPAVGG